MKPIAVILAGGIGKRFAPFVTPKPLFPFFDLPILVHTLNQCLAMNLTEVVIIASPDNQEKIRLIHLPGLKISVFLQPKAGGMGQAILEAKSYLNHKPILVLNAATLVDPNLYLSLVSNFANSKPFLVAKKVTHYFPGGYLQFKGSRLSAIIEKPVPGTEPSDLITLVINYFPNASPFIALLASQKPTGDDQYEQALTKYIQTHPMAVIPYTGYWFSLKYPHHVLTMMSGFLKYQLKASQLPKIKLTSFEGPIYFGKNVTIMPGAIIKGPVYLGDNVIIGDHTIVRESMVGEGSVLGSGSEIVRSYIGSGCNIHRAYIGDSVLEGDVNVGAGTVTANWRFDGEKVGDSGRDKLGALIASGSKLGIQVATFPGVTLGAGSIIGPGTLVSTVVPAHTLLYHKPVLTYKTL